MTELIEKLKEIRDLTPINERRGWVQSENGIWYKPGFAGCIFNPKFFLDNNIFTRERYVEVMRLPEMTPSVDYYFGSFSYLRDHFLCNGYTGDLFKFVHNGQSAQSFFDLDTPSAGSPSPSQGTFQEKLYGMLGITLKKRLYISDTNVSGGKIVFRTREEIRYDTDFEIPEMYRAVNSYKFAPLAPTFLKDRSKSQLFFGLELEISSECTPEELYLIQVGLEPKQEPFFYIKHDGSVTGYKQYKYELVTHPSSPKRLKKDFRIFFKKLQELTGSRLSDAFDVSSNPSNGLHIHINKKSFSSRLHQNKFGSIWNQWDSKNLAFLNSLSKRIVPIQESQYYNTHPSMKYKTKSFRLKHGAECYGENGRERYSAARMTPSTLEVRVFQSIFDLDHILYCIELTEAMHRFSEGMSIRTLDSDFKEQFISWLHKQSDFNKLRKAV